MAAKLGGARSTIIVPMLKDERLIGTIVIYRQEVRPFTAKQIELVQSFASQAVVAIENARLLSELRESLSSRPPRRRAQGHQPLDLRPAGGSGHAGRVTGHLCRADRVAIRLARGGLYHNVASYGFPTKHVAYMRSHPVAADRTSIVGRVVLTGKSVHIPDADADPELTLPQARGLEKNRTVLGVPLLRDRKLIGVLVATRLNVESFTDKQIELLTTFADQAVIAIENVRLFDEVQARSRELSEALEQQTATSEVLQVISRSPGELEPVFQAMLSNAVRVCEAKFGVLFRYSDNAFHAAATLDVPPHTPSFSVADHSGLMWACPRREIPSSSLVVEGHCSERRCFIGSESRTCGSVRGARSFIAVPLKESELVGALRYLSAGGTAIHRQADRVDPELRRAGRNRHREHPPAQRAAPAHQ